MKDKRVFEKHSKDKIVLVKSFISNGEMSEFEYETRCKVFYNMPALDERKEVNREVNTLLAKLGFVKQSTGKTVTMARVNYQECLNFSVK